MNFFFVNFFFYLLQKMVLKYLSLITVEPIVFMASFAIGLMEGANRFLYFEKVKTISGRHRPQSQINLSCTLKRLQPLRKPISGRA